MNLKNDIFSKFIILRLFSIFGQFIQPYFPQQVVFSPDNNRTIIAIDVINQRAYLQVNRTSEESGIAYVMKHMPYTKPDSPQANHYVQLLLREADDYNLCSYSTYWKYSLNMSGLFPLHWSNSSAYEIKNYINFKYPMIYSKKASKQEDYWHSNESCRVHSGEVYPCQEIYFKKNTEIPIRYADVARVDSKAIRQIVNFTVYSTEKPSDTFFNSIPKNWFDSCQDDDLRVAYNPNGLAINLNESAEVQVWLTAPPHRIPGNDTVVIHWTLYACSYCLQWTPTHLVFNATNFQERQTLNITRIEISEQTDQLRPVCTGGGYDNAECYSMYLGVY